MKLLLTVKLLNLLLMVKLLKLLLMVKHHPPPALLLLSITPLLHLHHHLFLPPPLSQPCAGQLAKALRDLERARNESNLADHGIAHQAVQTDVSHRVIRANPGSKRVQAKVEAGPQEQVMMRRSCTVGEEEEWCSREVEGCSREREIMMI